jgi:hypothetical protein
VCIYIDYIYVGEDTQCDIALLSGTRDHKLNIYSNLPSLSLLRKAENSNFIEAFMP